MQETQVLNQLLWLPLIFRSGATIPLGYMPAVAQRAGLFLPATYLVNSLQQSIVNGVSIWSRHTEFISLTCWAALTFFLSAQLFRWEPESKIPRRAKLLVAATAIPFLLLGVWENRTDRILNEAKSAFDNLTGASKSEQHSNLSKPAAPGQTVALSNHR